MSVQGIDARELHGIRVAHFEDAILSIVRHVVGYTDTIECIPAITSRIGPSRVANLKRRDVAAKEPGSEMSARLGQANQETNMFHSWTWLIVLLSALK